MITEYHETTGNSIYKSDDLLFSSSNPNKVTEFESTGIKSKFDFESTGQANKMLSWGHCPIAQEFLDDYYRCTRDLDYHKKYLSSLDTRTSSKTNTIETTLLIYKAVFEKFIELGYKDFIVAQTGLNSYSIGFNSLRNYVEANPLIFSIIFEA